MARSGPTRTERSLNTPVIPPSLCPLSSYSGRISSSVRPEWTLCSSREWGTGSWTSVLSSKPSWPLSCPIPLAWTRDWECTPWKSTGGSLPCLSPSWFSSTMKSESSCWDVTLEDGSRKKLIIKDSCSSEGSNLWPYLLKELFKFCIVVDTSKKFVLFLQYYLKLK